MAYEGNVISIDKAKKAGWDHYEIDENDFVLEKSFDISEQHLEGFVDELGYNGYSVVIHLEGSTIKEIDKIGHIHMGGGEGTDETLGDFPGYIDKHRDD